MSKEKPKNISISFNINDVNRPITPGLNESEKDDLSRVTSDFIDLILRKNNSLATCIIEEWEKKESGKLVKKIYRKSWWDLETLKENIKEVIVSYKWATIKVLLGEEK